jgi:hypothetical protein
METIHPEHLSALAALGISLDAPTEYPIAGDAFLLITPMPSGLFDVHHIDGGVTNWGEIMTAGALVVYLAKSDSYASDVLDERERAAASFAVLCRAVANLSADDRAIARHLLDRIMFTEGLA